MIKFYSIKKFNDKIKNKIYSFIKKVIKQNNFILGKDRPKDKASRKGPT